MKPYYQDQSVTIYHGDNAEILPTLGKFDAVITDPPYGINTKSDGNGKLNPWADLCNSSIYYKNWFLCCKDKLKPNACMWTFLNWRSMVTFQKASCDAKWPIESLLIWDKSWIGPGGIKGLRPSYEMVALFTKGEFAIADRSTADVQVFKWSSVKPTGHPAEKPLDLMKFLIEKSSADTILDPFAGSGTTGRAAKDLGKQAVLIEMDEQYCEIAAQRMAQEVLL